MPRSFNQRPAPEVPAPILSGLNGAMPTVYDPKWQTFTDLNDAQKQWYTAQPEWQNFLAWVALDPVNATIHADTPDAVIQSALLSAGQTLATAPTTIPVIQVK